MSDELQEDVKLDSRDERNDDVLAFPVVMPVILPHPMYIPKPDPVYENAPVVYFN